MKNRFAWMMMSLCSFGVSQYGCHINNCEEGAVCGFDEQAREKSCQSFCDRLVVCGNVAGNDHDACMATCFDEYDRDPAGTAGACRCVSRASCSEISERHCPEAPVIGGGYTTGSTTGGHTTSTTTGSTTSGSTASTTTGGPTTSSTTSSSTTSSSSTSTTSSTGAGGASGYDAGGAGGSTGASDAALPPCGHD